MTTTRKSEYATVIVPGTKKVSVCARRVGTKDRLSVIATCNDETTAEKIVAALNALQDVIDKIDAPSKRVLEDVRAALQRSTDNNKALEMKKRELENKVYELERSLNGMRQERDRLRAEFVAYRDAHTPKENA